MSSYITMDSFGASLPANWQEIADYLNNLIDERGIADDPDELAQLWEDYCNGDIPGAPAALDDGIVLNQAGTPIDYAAAVNLMDDELREQLADDLATCTDQEFFTAYEKAHAKKYGETWELSKRSPQW